ncbi:MFS transporter [Pelagibacterium lentulum]|uniref:MFS transporter n=1 Tax=Pelagibacterium lentulum TaxID=2029865 RepID=A0A916R884_9HYPH|nr:MFS transporter [Pelagibacterium lentulum]GGA40283.1 MFS transporter [Pelagibacterium lentulum]
MASTVSLTSGRLDLRARLVIAALMLGLFISALDFMIMTVALRTIADQLGGLSFQGWATSSYVIASTITAPLYGRLADRFGGRRIYMAALGLFLSGSALCALSGSMLDLALWRAVKGLGGGGLMTLALTIMADMLSPELRTRYAAWSGVVFTTASLLGPALGGFFAGMDEISGFAGWRWMFLINLPLGLLPLLAVAAFAPRKAGREGRPVDLAGAALMGLSVTPLLVAFDLGMRSGPVPVTLGLMAVGLVSLALLVRVQLFKGDDALLPPRLFQHRAFLALNGLNITLGMALFVAAAVVPLYLQIVKGFPPTVAGLLLVPQSLMTTVAALLADRLAVASGRYRVLLIFASIGWAFADRDSPIWLLVGVVMLHGAGMGMALQILLIAMQNAVPSSMLGLANGLYGFGRQLGGAVGAVLGTLVLFRFADQSVHQALPVLKDSVLLAAASDDASQKVVAAARGLGRLDLNDTGFLENLDAALAAPVRQGFGEATSKVFLLALALFGLSIGAAALVSNRTPADEENEGMAGNSRSP